MIDLLGAFHLWRVVREILVDLEGESKASSRVHALIGLDGEGEVEDVVGVGEFSAHRRPEGEFAEIYMK